MECAECRDFVFSSNVNRWEHSHQLHEGLNIELCKLSHKYVEQSELWAALGCAGAVVVL